MKRCMYCGHENEDSLVSCSVCGNKLGIAVPTQEPVIVKEEPIAEPRVVVMTRSGLVRRYDLRTWDKVDALIEHFLNALEK